MFFKIFYLYLYLFYLLNGVPVFEHCVGVCLGTHSVGVGLYGQSCVDREHFEEEGQLALEGVLNLGAQTGREVGDPLAQCGLRNPVVFNLGIAFWVGAHPELKQEALLWCWYIS